MSTEHSWLQTRYGVRLPDGSMATSAQGQVWSWTDIADAERAIGYFRSASERLGHEQWDGEIVRQLCTPWIGERDNADTLIAELSAWLSQQIGEQQ